jgi:hypothetical protein
MSNLVSFLIVNLSRGRPIDSLITANDSPSDVSSDSRVLQTDRFICNNVSFSLLRDHVLFSFVI